MNQNTHSRPESGQPSAVLLDLYERMRTYRVRQNQAEADGIPALQRLVRVAQGRSGQCHHVRRFLLGVYNDGRWPFELNRLRALDEELQADCLKVLQMNLTPRKEPHLFINNGDEIFQGFWEIESAAKEED